ncbi:MAG: hypothetical protein ACHQ1H_13585 [Nitrososphaerales archaeon]
MEFNPMPSTNMRSSFPNKRALVLIAVLAVFAAATLLALGYASFAATTTTTTTSNGTTSSSSTGTSSSSSSSHNCPNMGSSSSTGTTSSGTT